MHQTAMLYNLFSFKSLPLYITFYIYAIINWSIIDGSVQIVPHFTSLPDPIVQFVSGDDFQFELICRAWPPNSKLLLLASKLFVSSSLSTSSIPDNHLTQSGRMNHPVIIGSDMGIGNNNHNLLPLPQGLGSQRFGIISSTKLTTNQNLQNTRSNVGSISNTGRGTMDNLISHETLLDAIRERPAAEVADEVGVRLIINSRSEMSQLELMKLHCLVGTSFGRILSAPFRVVPSTLGQFPAVKSNKMLSTASFPVENVEFLRGNVAIVDCYLPLDSYPRPMIDFELNNTVIEITTLSEKYRQVNRPDGKRVSLLINNFQSRDCGIYRCVATNPLTKEKKHSPEAVNLKIIKPESPVAARIRVPLASQFTDTQNSPASQEISVNEGDNVTLFCVIQSAPPPIIATYPFDKNFTAHNRFHAHSSFGLLEITNVQPSDAGIYICSDRQISSTAQLHVRARLRLTTMPQDVRITKFGESAQFTCTTSDHRASQFWLFNGKPKIIGVGKGHTLTISNVTEKDLGLYQCVAQKSTTEPNSDEWVSATAILAMQTDKVIRTSNELSALTPMKTITPVEQPVHDMTTSELTPVGESVYDNLAVYITWAPFQKSVAPASSLGESPGQSQNKVNKKTAQVAYRLEYSIQFSPMENNPPHSNSSLANHSTIVQPNHFPKEQIRALIGLVGYDAIKWSEPVPLNQQFSTPYAYVTGEPLEPSRRYRFRVIALDPSSGLAVAPPSGWSNIVGMEHISRIEPPQIKIVRPMSDGRVFVVWMFNGIGGEIDRKNSAAPNPSTTRAETSHHTGDTEQHRLQANPTAAAVTTSTISMNELQHSNDFTPFDSETHTDQFVADHFLILARPVIKPKRRSGSSIEYGAYWATQINGSSTREGVLTGLNSTAHYQIIVYGVRGEGDNRQITRFSKAVYVNMASTDYSGRYSLLETLSNNRLMYFILGGIAGLMFLVMFVLILLCLCRQHQARRRTSQRKKQNGYVKGYKDNTDFRALDSTVASDTNPQPNGPAMKHPTDAINTSLINHINANNAGTTIQCNQMPEHPMSNHMSAQQQQQLQQTELQQQRQQQQQMDQYNTNISKEMFQQQQQQRQAMMGSQMQLQFSHHPHHQSHQSLLLPSCGGNMNTMMQPGTGHHMMIPPPNMFHSGTLPGGPRYLRQQQAYSAHFGSQQPLNRTSTPANNIEMTEFYNHPHHQQQQIPGHYPYQGQLPPVPHPQSTGLPPPYPAPSNGTINRQMFAQQQQMYYPGAMTPSGTSLRREPPTGGSIQDGSAYGTLLQRGQLTSSMMTDPSAGAGNTGANMDAVYYHGSQQALHMYPNGGMGMATPQQQHQIYLQQQQAQMYPHPGCFSPPPMLQQQHFEMMGHGHHGPMHTDGESVYSYFSQHEMNQLGAPAQHLNTLPEENQLNPNEAMASGFVESGMQTNDAAEHLTPGTDGSPNAGNGHRHHRRRRRKQHQQQQQPTTPQPGIQQQLENQNGEPNNQTDGDDAMMERFHHQSQSAGAPQMQELNAQTKVMQRHPDNGFMEADQLNGQHAAMPTMHSSSASYVHAQPDAGRYMRYDSPQRAPLGVGRQLPPPNQPPPPPPPPVVAMGFASPGMNPTTAHNEHNTHQSSLPFQNHYIPDSLSRRACSPHPVPLPTGVTGTASGCYSSSSGAGLLVGPPPRIRDYSEYGIPRGVGLPPTPLVGNQSSGPQQQHNIHNGGMYFEEHYREGQA